MWYIVVHREHRRKRLLTGPGPQKNRGFNLITSRPPHGITTNPVAKVKRWLPKSRYFLFSSRPPFPGRPCLMASAYQDPGVRHDAMIGTTLLWWAIPLRQRVEGHDHRRVTAGDRKIDSENAFASAVARVEKLTIGEQTSRWDGPQRRAQRPKSFALTTNQRGRDWF